MRSPQSHLRNGEPDNLSPPPPPPRNNHNNFPPSPHDIRFQSTLSVHKLKRFNSLILVFRIATFVFSLSSFVFMLTNSRSSPPHWFDFDAFRFVLAANGIVAVYSLVEMVAAVWEITTGATLFPEVYQVWFDFGHDQVFAYMLLSANSAGTALVKTLKGTDTCTVTSAFCVQSDISIALGFAGFLFLGFSSLMSGFRVACFVINGSRFHL
ncbi:CASP-like protein 4C1 [Chenopodium quinoa]|uniref:CASP-like protein n=1 Tax=Chenopodium quinoa TaxID=63459 RepID=A0A803MK08_CHEQI|nr:CASP-like protein 4C1 [Chenopodium quinoa]